MNKFEALKTFQSWPPEWQRLCAECWIETGEVDPKFVLAFPKQAASKPLVQQRSLGDCIDQGEMKLGPIPKAAKVAAVKPARNFMRYTRDEISEVDAHLSEGRGPTEISVMMVRKHPNKRTREAWRKMAQWVRKHGFLVSMNQAVEAEVE
jgi:hypothetical protein